jgi:transposase
MDMVVFPRCAGIDIGKRTAVVCIRVQQGSQVTTMVETWAATSTQVLALADRLIAEGVTRVVMEATSDYWKKYFFLLQAAGLDTVLANPRHIKQLPGRKTDVQDAVWIAQWAAMDAVRPSFVPAAPVRQLRDLVRTRTVFTRQRTQIAQRVEKLLESAAITLSATVTDIFGVTGRAILDGLASGQTDPASLADLKRSPIRASRDQLIEALTGGFTSHQAFELASHLRLYDAFSAEINQHSHQIARYFDPDNPPGPVVTPSWAFDAAHKRDLLNAIPGINTTAAEQIIAEIGTDLHQFPDAPHLVSWAGLAPGANQSAGKTKSTQTRPGDSYLKAVLGQVALSAGTRAKNTFWNTRFKRVAFRGGANKALVAVAAGILTAIYHIIRDDTPYQDLGPDYYTKKRPKPAIRKAITTLTDASCQITTNPDGTLTITLPPGITPLKPPREE